MDNIHVGLNHFLVLGTVLFAIGLYSIISGKSAFAWLAGLQFILAAINICFAALSKYQTSSYAGEIAPVFIIILGTFQIAIAAFFALRHYKLNDPGDSGDLA